MAERKQFQTETKQLLDLMINSIYTHKEIFLRELISNASDAIDKLRFESIKNPDILGEDKNLCINLSYDEENLYIEDNGIGLNYEDAVENLGTIAKSGTKVFMEKLKDLKNEKDEMDLIGQFGVGFYSAFMVADEVIVESLKYDQPSEKAIKWVSKGDGEYEIENINKEKRGTKITLHIRKDLNDFKILDEFIIKDLIKKYSNYIKYPIKMEVTEYKEEGKQEKEIKTLNSMESLWRKNKSQIKDEEYNQFYKENFYDWNDPLKTIHFKAEGSTIQFTALLFIPSKAPFNYYTKEFKRGLNLYSKNVFIMEKYEELLPKYFSFVKGLIDSPDFSLNISREILQHSRNIELIKKNIEKKITSELKTLIKDEREKYIEFWEEFGRGIKAGLYESIDSKDKVEDLLLFKSSNENKYITLSEYKERMKEDQKYILYAVGDSISYIESLPQMEMIKEKGFEVIYLLDEVDEFLIQMLNNYKEIEFKSISSSDLELGNKEEKDLKQEENKDLLSKLKELLKDKVEDVRVTDKLKKSPACIVSSDDNISINMQKILKQMDGNMPFNAKRVLELNPEHQVFNKLKDIYQEDSDSIELSDIAYILYNQALLVEGIELENPAEFAEKISNLLIK
ncbi:molecular chaperone HtpG [Oceanotoga teriensis]|uniref:molecular chaperone HtpG n=1 Tax=Oceanotoga teriensis TaxID=515440 RepID=UPI00271295E5|nr:molecular chaperone HtpG [Oceanotoga teriensis]MDO7976417.1 molecular chaperone HtpG [Oceanotoga teriensis]